MKVKMFDGNILADIIIDDDLLEALKGKRIYTLNYPCFLLEKDLSPMQVYVETEEDYEQVEAVVKWSFEAHPTEITAPVFYWDDLVLWPTLMHYVELYQQGRLDDVLTEWRYIRHEFGDMVAEMFENVLGLGTINQHIAEADLLKVVTILALMSMPPAERFNAVRSWYLKGDDGRVNSISWLFQPSETAHLSPVARMGREKRVAFGQVWLENGNWGFAPLSNVDKGRECDRLIKAGFPVVPHDKMKYASLSTASFLEENKLFIPSGDMNKAEKVFDRRKLISGTSAKAVCEEASYLKLDDGTGPRPVTVGTRIKAGMSNAVAAIGLLSGGALARPDFVLPVIERRVFRAQVLKSTKLNIKKGTTILPGESVIGIEGLYVYDLPYPGKITEVSMKDGEGQSNQVNVTVELIVNSTSPKLRAGGVKASVHRSMSGYLTTFLQVYGIDVLFGTETLKNHLTLLQLWADTERREVILTKAGLNETDEADFAMWLNDNLEEELLISEITEELAPYMLAAGHTVSKWQEFRQHYSVEERIQLICGELVVEVETPVTELRAVRTAPTYLAWSTLASQYKDSFEYYPQATYDLRLSPTLSMADTKAALELGWADGLAYLAEKYPYGAKITNGADAINQAAAGREGVESSTAYVDFKALVAHSHGQIEGDDIISIALYEVLHNKAYLGSRYEQFTAEQITFRELRDASQRLYHALEFLRSATKSFVLSSKLLRTLARPARCAALLTVRGYNHIPVSEVWVSPATAEKFGLRTGSLYMVGRFPGAALLPHFLKEMEGLDDGCVFINTWAMQVGNKGDADGDQAYIFRFSDIGNMYARNWHERDTVVRMLTMVLANQGAFTDANGATPPSLRKWRAPRVNLESCYQKAELEYIKHSGVAESGLTGFFKKACLRSKLGWKNGVSGVIDLSTLKPNDEIGPLEAMGDFAVGAIGGCYAMMHNLTVIEQVDPAVREARLLSAALYEDFALSGYKPAKYGLHTALKVTSAKDGGDRSKVAVRLVNELDGLGFKATESTALGLLMARTIHASFSSMTEGKLNMLIGENTDWMPYIALCQAWRSLTSGRADLIVPPDEWQDVVALIPEQSPLAEVAGAIGEVYELLYHTAILLEEVNRVDEWDC